MAAAIPRAYMTRLVDHRRLRRTEAGGAARLGRLGAHDPPGRETLDGLLSFEA